MQSKSSWAGLAPSPSCCTRGLSMVAGAIGVGVAPCGLSRVHAGCWGAPEHQELWGLAPREAGQSGGSVGLVRSCWVWGLPWRCLCWRCFQKARPDPAKSRTGP